jgi:hypothetical protein
MVGPSSEQSGCSRTTAAVPRAPLLPFLRARATVPLLPPRVTPPHWIWIPRSVLGGGGVEHGGTIENSRRWRWGGASFRWGAQAAAKEKQSKEGEVTAGRRAGREGGLGDGRGSVASLCTCSRGM